MGIKTITSSNSNEFELKVNELLKKGYKVLSTNCGFINSEQYDFCDYWQAILISEPSAQEKYRQQR